MKNTFKHNLGLVALTASAWVGGADMALAQTPISNGNFGTEVVNIATIDFTSGSIVSSIDTNAAVFTIKPPQTPAQIEFFRYSPNAPNPIYRNFHGSDFSPSGELNGPFEPVGDAITAGGNILDLSGDVPLIPATTYLSGELMIVRVVDMSQNANSQEIDTVAVTVVSGSGDMIVLRLYESSPDSGEFWAYMTSTDAATANYDKIITAGGNESLRATYVDTFDQTDVVIDTAIVNPLNRVFSSVSGDLIDEAVIKLMNVDTGAEATVYGVDGFSAFPPSVISGDDVQDESGLIYEVDQGEFRFPVLAPGRYVVEVEPPEGYTFASVLPVDELQNIKGSGFVLTPASFGQEFVIEEMSPLRFDIPLDPEAEMVLTKTADRTFGDIGDYINYTVTVRNTGTVSAPARIYDTLPLGFRYVPGTTRLEQDFTTDPSVASDAALLEFDMGVVGPGETTTLNYALLIGPGAALGDAVNAAVVVDSEGRSLSNIGRASITLREDLLRSTSTIVGRMTEQSCNGNEEWARNIDRGIGVEGVRLYMETGAYTVSDSDGLFHFEGVSEGTHVVQVDEETLPQGFELMQCEENTRYAGAMNSQFVDVQGGGIWRANFYLKQTSAREDIVEEEVYNDRTDYKRFDTEWLETQTSNVEWVYPETTRTPSSPSVHIGIKHGAGQSVELTINDRPVFAGNFSGRESNFAQTVYLSRWRSVDLLDGRNVVVATIRDKDGSVAETLRREVNFVKTIARAIPMPDQSILVADGRTVPIVAIRMEDQAGRAVHAGRITSIEVEPPYKLFDENDMNDLREQTQDLITPLSAKRDFAIGNDGVVEVKLEPTLRTGKVTVIATLDNGRKIPVYMYLTPEKRDWILVGLAEGSVGRYRLEGNSVAIDTNGGGSGARDVITDGRVAFFAKGLIKGNWLMSLAVDTDKHRTGRDGGFNSEIDPNAYYTLYGDRSYQEFEGVSRYPVFVKLEKSQAYAMFGDYSTNISEGRLTSYNRQLSGLKAEYIGDDFQVLGFAAETNQGFAQDEIAADGTSGTYQLSNERLLAQSEEIVIETRDRFRPDVILERKVMVRYLDYKLDYLTGQLIFRLPVDATDQNFNPNVIVAEYETSEDAERNITAGGRVQAEFLDDKLRIGSTFVHEEGSAQAAGSESNQIGIDILAQVSDKTQIRAEYAITENKNNEFENTADATLLEVIHTSENLTGEAFFREEEAGFGLGQTGSNTNAVRRYGVKSNIRVSEFEDEETGRRGSRFVEAQAFHEKNLNTGDTRNTAEILATHEGVRTRLSTGLRVSEDQFETREDRQSVLAIAKASIELPKHGATFQISHEQPLSGNDEVSAFPMRTVFGVDKTLGNRATASIRHELLDGNAARSHNTVVGVNASLWQGGTIAANSDLLTQDSGRRLGASIGLDQNVQLSEKWSMSAGVRERRILEADAEFVEVAPDAAVSPIEVNEDFRSAYLGAAYRDDVMSGSARLEGRQSSAGDSYIGSAAVARELSEELSLAGALRTVFNETDEAPNATSRQADLRLGAAWRPRDEDMIVFNRFDFGHSKDVTGQTTTKIVNNVAVNTQISDRWQLTGNWGAKHVRSDVAGQTLKNNTHLLGAETRYDLTPNLDLGFRAQMMTSSGADSTSYSYGPSVGLNPAKNVWLSAGYNVQGFKDDDFEAAEYSRRGFYLQMRVKFDQNTARDLLRRISPANDVVGSNIAPSQAALSNP